MAHIKSQEGMDYLITEFLREPKIEKFLKAPIFFILLRQFWEMDIRRNIPVGSLKTGNQHGNELEAWKIFFERYWRSFLWQIWATETIYGLKWTGKVVDTHTSLHDMIQVGQHISWQVSVPETKITD